MLHKAQSGESIKISFDSETPPQKNAISPQHSDYNMFDQVLYILDRFVVGDEAYHELSMISNLLPLHKVKTVRLALNNSLDLKRFPEQHLGAYRPFEATLKNEIAKEVIINNTASYQEWKGVYHTCTYDRKTPQKVSLIITPKW